MNTLAVDTILKNNALPVVLQLYLQLSNKGAAFALLNKQTNQLLGLGSTNFSQQPTSFTWAENIDNALDSWGIEINEEIPVNIAWVGGRNTLVPTTLFNADSASDYFKLNLCAEFDETLYHESLKPAEATNVYAVPNGVVNYLNSIKSPKKILHHSTVLLNSLMLSSQNNNPQVFINIGIGCFDFVVLNNNKLQNHVYYEYTSNEDFVYFTLNALRQLNFNPQSTPITFMGEVEERAPMLQLLRKYVASINLLIPQYPFSFAPGLSKIKPHFYYILLNLHLCE